MSMSASVGSQSRPIRVMICDDSSVVRSLIARALDDEPSIEVVASVANGALAVDLLRRTPLDIIILDVEMPVMDGLTALPLLLRIDPKIRVIVASALTSAGAAIALKAIQAGAADCMHKPSAATRHLFAQDIKARILGLGMGRGRPAQPGPIATQPAPAAPPLRPAPRTAPLLLAFGSSTGGPQALFSLFGALSQPFSQPIILTQHMPPLFTRSLAEHLARLGHRPAVEAEDGMPLLPDRIHVAPGDHHLLVATSAGGFTAKLSDAPPENSCRPAVDPMLRSASTAARGRVLATILTGMGRDGAGGGKVLVEAGGTILAQDEASSVVWGMPGAVAREGLCHAVMPIDRLAARITELARLP